MFEVENTSLKVDEGVYQPETIESTLAAPARRRMSMTPSSDTRAHHEYQ